MRAQWLTEGYFIARGLLDVSEAVQDMHELFPPSQVHPVQDFGNANEGSFPTRAHLNRISVHSKLLDIVRECLGTTAIHLTQSVAWAKYGTPSESEQSNRDQRVHMDYGNHYWTSPPEEPDMIAAIVYYSDTEVTGGATAVVSRNIAHLYKRPYSHMPGIGGIPFINQKDAAEKMMAEVAPESAALREECYEHEIRPEFKPGDVLFYRMDTWHRGTPVHEGQVRYVHNLTWKRADAEGICSWNPGFTRKLYYGPLERFISELEPNQLESLGFPARDSAKWERSKFCKDVRARYGWAGFNLDAYMTMPDQPPPLPAHWPISSVTFEGPDAHSLRDELFEKMRALGVHIEAKNSRWQWRLEFCEGPHYVHGECFFFQKDGTVLVDVNQLHGDRWVWWRMIHKLRGEPDKILERVYTPTKTSMPFVPSMLKQKKTITEDYIAIIGQDVQPNDLLYLLEDTDLNSVRFVMWRLSQFDKMPQDVSAIQAWTKRPVSHFLEREIVKHAHAILQKQSRL